MSQARSGLVDGAGSRTEEFPTANRNAPVPDDLAMCGEVLTVQ